MIGGSVAGLSAAQMLGRARRRTLVIDAGSPRNRVAAHLHGALGHDGLDPADLLARGRDEVRRYGVELRDGTVVELREGGAGLAVTLADGTTLATRAAVIATGVVDRLPDVEGLAARWGRDVLHCPYCHGFEVADQRLGVIVTSPAGIHQLELVRQWSEHVTAFVAAVGPLDDDVAARLVARDVRLVESPVLAVKAEHDTLAAAVTQDGERHPLDAVFVAPTPEIDLGFAADLALARTDGPGSPLVADPAGATSHPRVWAAGNVVAPYGNIAMSMGSGSMAGAGLNAGLVAQDAAAAVVARRDQRNATWEARYTERDAVWSGRVNASLAGVAEPLAPGTALDVGCGEGGDAVWLAERGWAVTGVDVSATAVRRATEVARARGLGTEHVRFLEVDAVQGLPDAAFDLVTASFLHSWERDFPRLQVLRSAAQRVAPGGRLLVLSHAAEPPWAHHHHDAPLLRGPQEELALIALPAEEWATEIAETRERTGTDPDGQPATLLDGVLLLRRTGPARQQTG